MRIAHSIVNERPVAVFWSEFAALLLLSTIVLRRLALERTTANHGCDPNTALVFFVKLC